jgi:hypothetical protein
MTKAPPKSGRHKDKRIIGGTLHNVMIERGKIVEDFGPVKKDQQYVQPETTNDNVPEEKYTSGLTLVTDDDEYQEQKTISDIKLVQIPTKTLGKKPTWEDILSKIPEPDPDVQNADIDTNTTQIESAPVQTPPAAPVHVPQVSVPVQTPPAAPVHVPQVSSPQVSSPQVSSPQVSSPQVSSPQVSDSQVSVPQVKPVKPPQVKKPPQIPEIKIPKLQINIPQKTQKKDALNNISNKLDNIPGNDTYPNKVVGTSLQKADVDIKSQQLDANIEKSYKQKEKRSMVEELEAELLNERKFEEWIKKQKFRENLEKAAKFAEETKQQFEEKIPELSDKIEGITGEVKGVEERLGTMDKSVGTLCTGVDCIKDDVKKYQENVNKYQESQQVLEKMVQDRFTELGEKVQSLEHPLFTCENCGEQTISPLSSYCPNCGSPIHSWSDESGEPIRGWQPYWKRIGREVPQ